MIQEWIELGPIHLGLPGAMRLRLGMRGDRIVEVQTEFGYLHRSILKEMLGQDYLSAQLRFSRIEPESALLLDRLFSEAVEKITATPVNARIIWIRNIAGSLNQLSGFLKHLAEMANRLGIDILTHVVLKHREAVLDLIELLTGSRHGYYYIVPGGVRYNLTEGFQERLETWIVSFRADYSRIRDLFLWTHTFQNRLKSLGRVIDGGKCGFSHVESRLIYSIEACERLCSELTQLLADRPMGEFLKKINPEVMKSEAVLELQTARGEWTLGLELDEKKRIKVIKITTPSDAILPTIPLALENESLEDVPLILASLHFKIAEIDR